MENINEINNSYYAYWFQFTAWKSCTEFSLIFGLTKRIIPFSKRGNAEKSARFAVSETNIHQIAG